MESWSYRNNGITLRSRYFLTAPNLLYDSGSRRKPVGMSEKSQTFLNPYSPQNRYSFTSCPSRPIRPSCRKFKSSNLRYLEMKFEIARLKRRCSRLAVAWLSIVWSSVALAQSPAPPVPSPNPEPVAAAPVAAAPAPAAAARRTMTVEERLQKLEGMNQRLLEQNQQLTHQLKDVTQKVNAPNPP